MTRFTAATAAITALTLAFSSLAFSGQPAQQPAQQPAHHATPHNLVCVGMENSAVGGRVWHVTLDFQHQKLVVDNQRFALDGLKEEGHAVIVYTKNFLATDGKLSYNALINNDGTFYLAQYTAKPEELVSGIGLTCHRELHPTPKTQHKGSTHT